MAVFPNPTPVFPSNIPGLTFEVHKRPTWATLEYMAISGRRTSSPQQAYPLWEFELKFDFLRDQTQNIMPYRQYAGKNEFTRISQLFLDCAGKYGQFYLDDPTDDSRMAQVIGTTDGTTQQFTMYRTWGTGANSFVEPVGGINTIYDIYLNGVVQSHSTYSIVANTNAFTFNAPPSGGQTITADFSFYYLCQFLEDQHDYNQFMTNLWELRSLKLRSVKQ